MLHAQLGDHLFSLPESYHEVSFKQFEKLRIIEDPESLIDTLNILTGLSPDLWEIASANMVEAEIIPRILYLHNPFPTAFILPDQIQIRGKWYDKPGDIGGNTLAQKLALEKACKKANKEGLNDIDLYPYVVALYMQPIVDGGTFDSSKVDALAEDIKECRVGEIFPLAAFFLTTSTQSLKKNTKDFRTPLPRKKSGLELTSSKSSESYQHLGLWRRLLTKLLMKFSWSRTALST